MYIKDAWFRTSKLLTGFFLLILCGGTAMAQRGIAYAWIYDANAASVSPTYSLNPSGQPVTASRTGTGIYLVTFPGSGIGGGWDLQVTAYGGGANYCKTGSWGGEAVSVLCFDTAGNPANSLFTVLGIANTNDKNIAFAWADQPSSASYTPSTSYSYNPTGGITITRFGTGSYSVTFTGQNLNAGTVQITSYGGGNSNCHSNGWGGSSASVGCENAAGAAVDSYFVIAIIPGGVAPSGIAYTWANNSTASSYTPASTYTYNPGGPVTITRSSAGLYLVTFNGVDAAEITGGDVRATAYSTTNRCKVLSWGSGGAGGEMTASVGCYNVSGVLTDSLYEVLVIAPSAGLGFFPVTPCRVADTRFSSGLGGPFGPPSMNGGSTRSFPIPSSACGIPSTALAYSLNVTVVPPGPLTYLSIWPTGQPQPVVSTLNSFDGQVVANAAVVPAGSGGAISVFVSDNTDVIIDIDGYFGTPDPAALAFYPTDPCRIADTRTTSGFVGPFGPPSMAGGSTRAFPVVSSSCAIPSSARAYSLNMTVVPPGPLTYLSVWPAGQSQPVVSTLNSLNGRIVANAAIVPAGTGGAIDVFVSNTTDVVIDIDGYFAPPAAGALYFYPVTPCRIADTRSGFGFSGPFGPPSLAQNATRNFPITSSSCGVPTTSQAYSLNMTAIPFGPLPYLTTWPTGQPQPVVSTLNSLNGTVVANAALVPAGAPNGSISVFVTNNTDLLIDINGYFAP